MKKTLLLVAMVVTSYNVFAFTTQGVWRWRNDDGSETSATWKAAQNIPITIASDSTLRLRIEFFNDGTDNVTLTKAIFQYSTNASASDPDWTTIDLTTTTNAFVLAGTSPN